MMRPRQLLLTSALAAAALAVPAATASATPPDFDFSCWPGEVEVDQQATCEIDFAFDPDTWEPVTFRWDVDGDGFDDGTNDEVTRSFSTPGTKTIRLQVTDVDGETAVESVGLDVYAIAEAAPFSMTPSPALAGDDVELTAAFEAGEESGARDYERRWDVDGDGWWDAEGGALRSVVATFDAPGTYEIRMRVLEVGAPAREAKQRIQTLEVNPEVIGPSHPNNPGGGGGGGPAGPGPAPVPKFGSGGPAPRVAAPAAKPGTPALGSSSSSSTSAKKKAKKATCRKAKAKKGKKAAKRCKAAKKNAKRKKR